MQEEHEKERRELQAKIQGLNQEIQRARDDMRATQIRLKGMENEVASKKVVVAGSSEIANLRSSLTQSENTISILRKEQQESLSRFHDIQDKLTQMRSAVEAAEARAKSAIAERDKSLSMRAAQADRSEAFDKLKASEAEAKKTAAALSYKLSVVEESLRSANAKAASASSSADVVRRMREAVDTAKRERARADEAGGKATAAVEAAAAAKEELEEARRAEAAARAAAESTAASSQKTAKEISSKFEKERAGLKAQIDKLVKDMNERVAALEASEKAATARAHTAEMGLSTAMEAAKERDKDKQALADALKAARAADTRAANAVAESAQLSAKLANVEAEVRPNYLHVGFMLTLGLIKCPQLSSAKASEAKERQRNLDMEESLSKAKHALTQVEKKMKDFETEREKTIQDAALAATESAKVVKELELTRQKSRLQQLLKVHRSMLITYAWGFWLS